MTQAWQETPQDLARLEALAGDLDAAVQRLLRQAAAQHWPGLEAVPFPPPMTGRSWFASPRPHVRMPGYYSTRWTVCQDGSWFWVVRDTVQEHHRRHRYFGSISRAAGGPIEVDLAGGPVPSLRSATSGLRDLAVRYGVDVR